MDEVIFAIVWMVCISCGHSENFWTSDYQTSLYAKSSIVLQQEPKNLAEIRYIHWFFVDKICFLNPVLARCFFKVFNWWLHLRGQKIIDCFSYRWNWGWQIGDMHARFKNMSAYIDSYLVLNKMEMLKMNYKRAKLKFFRTHLHMTKNLSMNTRRILDEYSTNTRWIVDEYSTKNISSAAKNLRRVLFVGKYFL